MHCPVREESSSLESFALDLGDCIGAESCVDLKSSLSDLEQEILSPTIHDNRRCRRRDKLSEKMKREKTDYPPPIPWLARTGKLPSHMPWIMKRYPMSDGRLIIREEKVKRHEYFQAFRSDGRLVLRLVPVIDEDEEEEEENDDNVHVITDDEDGEVDGFVDVSAEVIAAENQNGKEDESLNNSSENCIEKCGGDARSNCMFKMTLASFRPVRT